MLAIPELDGGFLHNHCSNPGSNCGAMLGSTPATQRYKGRLCRIRTHEIADPCGWCLIGTVAIPDLNGRFLHDRWTNLESDSGRLSGSTPATQRYKIDPSATSTHHVTGLNGVGCWRSQNSMADYSTTRAPTLDPIVGRCWAPSQLHGGISYVLRRQFPMEL